MNLGEQVVAADDDAFQAFAEATAAPQLESWWIDRRVDVVGGSIELWEASVADGLIQYVHLAVAKDTSGAIAAIAALEAMPGIHDELFLGLFERGPLNHQNFGESPELVDPEAFLAGARTLLEPSLAPGGPAAGE